MKDIRKYAEDLVVHADIGKLMDEVDTTVNDLLGRMTSPGREPTTREYLEALTCTLVPLIYQLQQQVDRLSKK